MKKTLENIWQFLGLTQQRIGRRKFLIAFLVAQWGLPLGVLLLVGLFYMVFGEENPILFLPVATYFASLILGLVVYIKICIRRVRDIGIAQSWWVLAIIPLVNIPFFIYLCFKKGKITSGEENSERIHTSITESKIQRNRVIIVVAVACFLFTGLVIYGIIKEKSENGPSVIHQEERQVSDFEELADLLFGVKEVGGEESISFREMIEDVLTRMDDLRYIEDVKYFERQKKLIFYLNSNFINDEHVESIISSLSFSVMGNLSGIDSGKLALFMDNDRSGQVYGWNFYRIYSKVQDEDCVGVENGHPYYHVCELYRNRDIPIPVFALFPIIETTPTEPKNLEILQIYIGHELIANFISGSVFDELVRLNLVGGAFKDGTRSKIPELKLK